MKGLVILFFILSGCAHELPVKKELESRSHYMGVNSVTRSKSSFSMNYKQGKVKRAYVSGRLLPSNDWFHGGYVDLVIKGGWE